jgi:hypothetical protein
MTGELWETARGPGQKFSLYVHLAERAAETVEIEGEKEGQFARWQEVQDFSGSKPDDCHFTLDGVSGEVAFGPLVRQPSGEERQYGKIPPPGRRIRFTGYRWGGGVVGNVGKETITILKILTLRGLGDESRGRRRRDRCGDNGSCHDAGACHLAQSDPRRHGC